jgi:3-isopropylmalate dehydrogenase
MLDALGRHDDAERVNRAVESAVLDGEVTRDVGGKLGTKAAGDAIRQRLT